MELSPETLAFINAHRIPTVDVKILALQSGRETSVDLPFALEQLAGWKEALTKLPSWAACDGLLYPPHLSMEQCSSELTARYKATLFLEDSKSSSCTNLVDLTGGFGVDFSFLAKANQSIRATYVERQEMLCERAEHNFDLLGLSEAEVVCLEAEEFLSDDSYWKEKSQESTFIFIDPARRDHSGGKVVSIADCQPDVATLWPVLKKRAKRVGIKLSPMLDLTAVFRELGEAIRAVHVVAVQGECKELLLLLEPGSEEAVITAVNISAKEATSSFSFTLSEEREARCEWAEKPLTYLYEPHAALMKAGAYRLLAQRFGAKKLHPLSHLYTSTEFIENFPGRSFRVVDCFGFSKKELKTAFSSLQKANLAVRNFPASVAELRKRWHLKEGGDTYWFATTLADGTKALIQCAKV
ncbi:MAG: SAM-dependent methyltransferase [Bacteroidaceae bacterium]|nr:SAM-dependent methyltransferase [Bacteroidaceae bacterium]